MSDQQMPGAGHVSPFESIRRIGSLYGHSGPPPRRALAGSEHEVNRRYPRAWSSVARNAAASGVLWRSHGSARETNSSVMSGDAAIPTAVAIVLAAE